MATQRHRAYSRPIRHFAQPTEIMANNDPLTVPDAEASIILPEREECCQAPCDPPWLTKPSCLSFTETKTVTLELPPARTGDFGRGHIDVSVTYEHRLCLLGKEHGGLAYTLTLLPGERMTVYQSERFRRTTSETNRFSVHTTFSQFVTALHQDRESNSTSSLSHVLQSSSSGDASAGGLGIAIPLGVFGTVAGGYHASSTTNVKDLTAHHSSDQFVSIAEQASQYTDMQRSVVVSTYEETETVNTTQRVLVNQNICYAVNYFVRKVLDVFQLTTRVLAVRFQVKTPKFTSALLTVDQLDDLPKELKEAAIGILKDLPKVGEEVAHPRHITVPTDGVVYDPELCHCSSAEPTLEQAEMIKLERAEAEALKLRLEVQLMELELQRRQALLAAGTLDPFEPLPVSNPATQPVPV